MPVIESPTSIALPGAKDNYTSRAVRRTTRDAKTRPSRMLSISSVSEDHEVLSGILGHPFWQILPAATCQEAIARLDRTRVSIILCEHSLPDGTWKNVLDHVMDAGTEVPLIVTSRLADEYLWAEVLNLGGYDVLAKPFSEREVLHAITSALLHIAHPVPRARAAGGA